MPNKIKIYTKKYLIRFDSISFSLKFFILITKSFSSLQFFSLKNYLWLLSISKTEGLNGKTKGAGWSS